MQQRTARLIEAAVNRAREKHQPFTTQAFSAFCIMAEEIGEAARAKMEGDAAQFEAECLDSIAVLVRMIEGDR